MKRTISLILSVLCVMSLCLSGCTKQEIEPVTVGELLDLLENEGYTNIQHEEGTSEYLLLDSGDSNEKDNNDIVININNVTKNNSEDYVSYLAVFYNDYTDEVENIIRTLFLKLTYDDELMDNVSGELKGNKYLDSKRHTIDSIEEERINVLFWDNGLEYSQENDVVRYNVQLHINGLE